ncbi:hypothetical protein C8Q75DRAFT_404661 [Abortiporus biennis]|nr:hypothetical protein C8Q75DRAFT_404661 [Abortiporus biennis]
MATTPGHMVLNFDILISIMFYLSNMRDLVALMQTCHALYRAAPPHILSLPYTIRSVTDFLSFATYVLSDGAMGDRTHLIKSLKFGVLTTGWHRNVLRATAIEALVKLIRRATNIQSLDIVRSEMLLTLDPQILPSILGLHRVKSIKVTAAGVHALELLRKIQSPVSHVELEFAMSFHADDPVPLLSAHTSTLESLVWRRGAVGGTGPQYIVLASLTLVMDDPLMLEPLMGCFPNLRSLRIELAREQTVHPVFIEECRTTNVSVQSSHPMIWATLDSLCGGTTALYSLGLVRPVKELQIPDIRDGHLFWFKSIVAESTPTTLELVANKYQVVEHVVKYLIEIDPTSLVNLIIILTPFDKPDISPTTLINLIARLGSIHLKFLKLNVKKTTIHRRINYVNELMGSRGSVEKCRTLTEELFDRMPTVEHVALQFGNSLCSNWFRDKGGLVG